MMETVFSNVSAIDLFCGVGGLSYGLQQAGIKVVAGVDFDSTCEYAFETNNNAKFIASDIRKLESAELVKTYWSNNSDIRILVGCAPCQPFSNHSNKIKNKESNEKWNLLEEFKRLIKEMNPDIVSMENVPNLEKQEIYLDFYSFLEENNFEVSSKIVFCPEYGIPQRRKRLVLLASKLGKIKLIPPTHNRKHFITVGEALKEIDGRKSDKLKRYTKLSEVNLKRIRASKPGGSWKDWPEHLRLECHKKSSGNSYQSVYGRMRLNDVSPTITTQFYNYGTGRFGHPNKDRALTIREGAILQTFPKDYDFAENPDKLGMKVLGRYIGNAVPPKLGEVIGISIVRHLEKQN